MLKYQLLVYKKDLRCRDGERLVQNKIYEGYSGNAMMDEIFYLKAKQYRPQDGYRLDFVSAD